MWLVLAEKLKPIRSPSIHKKALQYGVTATELFDAVSKSNINVGGDVIVQSGQAYVVRGIGVLNNIDEIKNMIVDNFNGTPIYVKTIAEVTESVITETWTGWPRS